MSAQKGKDVLLKISDGGEPPQFSTIGGLRTRSLSLNARPVDVSHAESPGWRELLDGAGLREASVAGAGVFLSTATAALVQSVFFAGTARAWQVILPGFGTVAGSFIITRLDYSGTHDGEAAMSLALASAGALSFQGA